MAHHDNDLTTLTRAELEAQVRALRAGIRQHRDSSGHALCWHHPGLWALLPETVDPDIAVPPWPRFLRGCLIYRQSLDDQRPDAPVLDAEFEGPAVTSDPARSPGFATRLKKEPNDDPT